MVSIRKIIRNNLADKWLTYTFLAVMMYYVVYGKPSPGDAIKALSLECLLTSAFLLQ